MSKQKIIHDKLQKKQNVYMLNDFEDAVIRISPIAEKETVTVKFKGDFEFEMDWKGDLIVETEISGKFITKEKYDKY